MPLRNLLLTAAAILVFGAGAGQALGDDQDAQVRQLNSQQLERTATNRTKAADRTVLRARPAPRNEFSQIGPDGMPATPEERARTERTPRDMSPNTGAARERLAQTSDATDRERRLARTSEMDDADLGDRRMAQNSERPDDQHMTTPIPPTTGTEAMAVTLSQVDQPDRTLVNAPVESKDGQAIGEVAQVTLDANGKAREVVLDSGTRIAAGELVYQPESGVLITRLSPSDLAPVRQNGY